MHKNGPKLFLPGKQTATVTGASKQTGKPSDFIFFSRSALTNSTDRIVKPTYQTVPWSVTNVRIEE